jgi:transcriptional regulator with XRE-family HTH domain
MDEEKTINQRVELFFKSKHISQQMIAKSIGVSRQAVNNWLSGNTPIPSKNIIKLFAAFENLNPRWVLNGTGEMEGSEQSLPMESLLITKKDTTIELLTMQLSEKEKLIAELQKEIGRMEERLKQFSK